MNKRLPIVVANIKAHQSLEEVKRWLQIVGRQAEGFRQTIIFCPSSPFLSLTRETIDQGLFKIKLGSQDISEFEQGPYTGEVAASQLSDLVEFAIIGHSERRKHFGETNEEVLKKVELALKHHITPILCISDLSQLDAYLDNGELLAENAQRIIFVYEPPSAISGDKDYRPENPENADKNASKIKNKIDKEIVVIYGGSINPENVSLFFSQKNIDGGLIGQASVDPNTFLTLLKNATI